MPLLEERTYYKPFEYDWAFEAYKMQQQMHWIPDEVNLADDLKDFNEKVQEKDKNLLLNIFKFFTQADVDVGAGYGQLFLPTFKVPEIRMMLSAFAAMEAVHQDAYSLLLETLGLGDDEYTVFMEIAEMKEKHEYLLNFNMKTPFEMAKTMAVYSAFTEGIQLFSSFAILMNFPRFNKMKGMGQIVSWSVRDESLHCEGIIKLFHTFCEERQCLTKAVKEDLIDICQKTVRLEDNFIDLAFEMGPINGMSAKEIKRYIRYIADWRLKQLGLQEIYMIEEHPLPWLAPLLNGVEHANFFEQRATEYSKGATRGDWNTVWSSFDNRQKAKAVNEDGIALPEVGLFGVQAAE